jgi:glutamate/tyrosine decarboxylase-like PLP-dependent enzyme
MTDTAALLAQARALAGRYLENLDSRDIMPIEAALARLNELHRPLPDGPTDAARVLAELDRIGSPATVATTGGRYFGFVVGGALPVAVAANWLATAWDQNAGTWILAPGAAELEAVAAEWLLDIFDLPRDATVGFVTGSTMGAFAAFAAARSALLRRAGWDVKRRGLTGAPPLRIVTSIELHPTNLAALGYAGFGLDAVERVPVDAQGRLIAEALPRLDDRTLVILQAGNINSGACDPFAAVADRAAGTGAWVHVDGAFGLWARASARTRGMTAGLERADSWSVDGHKWLNLPQDSAVYMCRDAEAVADVFGVTAPYIVTDGPPRRQPNTLTPELSRRARGVEFWAALAHLGRSGVESLIDRCCAHARRFAEGLAAAGYEVMNDVVLNQVVFAARDEAATGAALAYIQASGVTWLGPTRWRGRQAMRISVSSWATTAEDVERSLAVMIEALGARAMVTAPAFSPEPAPAAARG